MKFIRAGIVIVFLGIAGFSHAAHITVFNSAITGDAANAGNGTGSLGKGSATMTFNSDTNEFSWFVAWEALTGPATIAHFHGPAAPDQNGPLELTIDHTMNPSIGSAILTPQQIEDVFAGLWYINIHTAAFPGGEIRGQVLALSPQPIPVPAAFWLFGSCLITVFGLRKKQTG